jgi:MoaA/NifB/PqqE/SkfB family radical SAM enzyme
MKAEERLRSFAQWPHTLVHLAKFAASAAGVTDDRALGGPVYAQIGISDACNHRCVMCEYHPPSSPQPPLEQFGGLRPGMISLETFEGVVRDLAALGTRQLDIVGRGEPLLHPQAVQMVALAKRLGFTVTLTTNGSTLNAQLSRELLEAGLDRLRISLNAARRETYPRIHQNQTPDDFDAVCRNVRQLCAVRPAKHPALHVSLSFVVLASNFHELTEMVGLAHSLGADSAHFQHNVHTRHADDSPLTRQEYDVLTAEIVPAALDAARRFGLETDLRALAESPPAYLLGATDAPSTVPCYVGHFFTAVLGNGQVMGCCQTQEALGNIADGGFQTVWNSDSYRRFRRQTRELPDSAPLLAAYECDRCFFRPHNVAVHRVLHPLTRIPRATGEALVPLRHFVRLSRLEKSK